MMTTKTKNKIKQWNAFVLFIVAGVMAVAQENGYLTNRIKPGDICYLDGGGAERFIDYRQWDSVNPPGELVGVVYYSYYGSEPYGIEGESAAWHGWIVAPDESEPVSWAPDSTICYDTCVALYPVEGVNTPYNPDNRQKDISVRDTCGWQNTYRLLEFIYTKHHTTLSGNTSPAFYYVFAEKNGVIDFSVKPTMSRTSWYVPAYGQLRFLYGNLGCINAAMAACGGQRFSTGCWYSSTEVGKSCLQAVWNLRHQGYSSVANGWLKQYNHTIRAVRNF